MASDMQSFIYKKTLWLWATRILSFVSFLLSGVYLIWIILAFFNGLSFLLSYSAPIGAFVWFLFMETLFVLIILLAIGASVVGIIGSILCKQWLIRLYYILTFVFVICYCVFELTQFVLVLFSGTLIPEVIVGLLIQFVMLLLVPTGCVACALSGILLDVNIKRERAIVTYNNMADPTYATTTEQPTSNDFNNSTDPIYAVTFDQPRNNGFTNI